MIRNIEIMVSQNIFVSRLMEMFDPLFELDFLSCHPLPLTLLCHFNSVAVLVKIFKVLDNDFMSMISMIVR